jgi:hypothetical protein
MRSFLRGMRYLFYRERLSNESRNELKQHYLTRYCAGTAVAIYVMTRDRFVCSRSKNRTEADELNWAD